MSARERLLAALHGSPELRPGEAERLVNASHAEVLAAATQNIVASCPDHGTSEETWIVCHCDAANELMVRAVLLHHASDDEPEPETPTREQLLLAAIEEQGGEWTAVKAHRWLVANTSPHPPRHFARHALMSLAEANCLTRHEAKGRRYYTVRMPF
ncbi:MULTISPECIES: hypothetical protein [unclassified Streptomyces]|uniref:hypothetical protein n=1 Tax=Streptomyces sp. NPDC127129 TaxID=3345373 RepID=UPI00363F1C99